MLVSAASACHRNTLPSSSCRCVHRQFWYPRTRRHGITTQKAQRVNSYYAVQQFFRKACRICSERSGCCINRCTTVHQCTAKPTLLDEHRPCEAWLLRCMQPSPLQNVLENAPVILYFRPSFYLPMRQCFKRVE